MTPRSRKVCVAAGLVTLKRRSRFVWETPPPIFDGGHAMTSRLRFGVFLAPFHKPGINPTLALQNDLDLVAWLDRLRYDEAWFGEHHAAGKQISASSGIIIA